MRPSPSGNLMRPDPQEGEGIVRHVVVPHGEVVVAAHPHAARLPEAGDTAAVERVVVDHYVDVAALFVIWIAAYLRRHSSNFYT